MGVRLAEHPASLAVLLLLAIVIFGWKRLPDASRSVARSLRIFKSEINADSPERPKES